MTAVFSAGFSMVFTLLGLGASSLGGLLAAYRTPLTLAGSLVVVLFGLVYLGWLKVPFLDRDVRLGGSGSVKGLGGAFLFGFTFALGWTPCAGPVLASVLSVASVQGGAAQGAFLLAAYSLGLALPLLGVAAFADRAVPMLRRLNRHLPAMQRVTGVVMVAAGLYLGADTARALLGPAAPGLSAVTTEGVLVDPVAGGPTPGPRLVELVEDGCPVCQRMVERVESLRQDCTQHALEVITINVSDTRNRALASRLNVRAVPTFLLVDDTGSIRGRAVGERTLDDLRAMVAGLQEESCAGVGPMQLNPVEESEACGTGTVAGEGAGSCG
jgi:cytochrome c-type biogenesis protein